MVKNMKHTLNIITLLLAVLMLTGCAVSGGNTGGGTGTGNGSEETGGSGGEAVAGEIRSAHPRLLLSPERLKRLRRIAGRDENGNVTGSPLHTWTGLENWLAPYAGKTVNNDNDLPYGMAGWHLALAYVITGNTGYADTAVSHVEYMVGKGTAEAIGSRFLRTPGYMKNVALVYDWLYQRLSAGQKSRWEAYMREIVDDLWTPDPPDYLPEWGTDQPANNFYYGHLLTTALYTVSAYYEDETARAYFGRLKDEWLPPAFAYLETGGKGGGWNEGSHYGQKSKYDLMHVLHIMKDSGAADYFSTLDYPRQALLFHLYNIQPGGFAVFHYGDMAMIADGPVQDYDFKLMAQFGDALAAEEQGYAQYWLNHADYTMKGWWRDERAWQFIYYDPERTERDYRELPTKYVAPGLGLVHSRSSWQADAVAVTFTSAASYQQGNHNHPDQNQFMIWQGGNRENIYKNWLATDLNMVSRTGIANATKLHNTILVDGQGQVLGDVEPPAGRILWYQAGDDYMAVAGDAARAYDTRSGQPRLHEFTRMLVHGGQDGRIVVVFDRVRPVDESSRVSYLLHNIDGFDYSCNVAVQKENRLVQFNLLPHNPEVEETEYQIDEEYGYENRYPGANGIKITNRRGGAKQLFLNVLYVPPAPRESPLPSTIPVRSEDEKMTGTLVEEGEQAGIFLFPVDAEAISSADYTVRYSGGGKHILTGMQPGTYRVSRDGTSIADVDVDEQGVLVISIDGGGKFRVSST
jgi:hypothetical protein